MLASFEKGIEHLKSQMARGVTLVISGDTQSTAGLLAWYDIWYSVLGGLFPHYALNLTRVALDGDTTATRLLDIALEPLWAFYRRHGSLRVIASIEEILVRVQSPCLPFPLQTFTGKDMADLISTLDQLNFLA